MKNSTKNVMIGAGVGLALFWLLTSSRASASTGKPQVTDGNLSLTSPEAMAVSRVSPPLNYDVVATAMFSKDDAKARSAFSSLLNEALASTNHDVILKTLQIADDGVRVAVAKPLKPTIDELVAHAKSLNVDLSPLS